MLVEFVIHVDLIVRQSKSYGLFMLLSVICM